MECNEWLQRAAWEVDWTHAQPNLSEPLLQELVGDSDHDRYSDYQDLDHDHDRHNHYDHDPDDEGSRSQPH